MRPRTGFGTEGQTFAESGSQSLREGYLSAWQDPADLAELEQRRRSVDEDQDQLPSRGQPGHLGSRRNVPTGRGSGRGKHRSPRDRPADRGRTRAVALQELGLSDPMGPCGHPGAGKEGKGEGAQGQAPAPDLGEEGAGHCCP